MGKGSDICHWEKLGHAAAYANNCAVVLVSELYGIHPDDAHDQLAAVHEARYAEQGIQAGVYQTLRSRSAVDLEDAIEYYDFTRMQLVGDPAIAKRAAIVLQEELVSSKFNGLYQMNIRQGMKGIDTRDGNAVAEFESAAEYVHELVIDATVLLQRNIDMHRDNTLTHLREFSREVNALHSGVEEPYFDDLLEAASIGPNGSRPLDKIAEYIAYCPTDLTNYRQSIHGEAFTQIKSDAELAIVQMLAPNWESRARKLPEITGKLTALREANADLGAALQLMCVARDKDGLLQNLSAPALSLYKTLRRANMPREMYAEFLANTADLPVLGTTMLEVVSKTAASCRHLANARFLAEHGLELLTGEHAAMIADLACSYDGAYLALSDYLDATRLQQANKATLALDLAKAKVPLATLKQLRGKLSAANETELAGIAQYATTEERISRLERCKRTATTTSAPKTARQVLSWYDHMIATLQAAGKPSNEIEKVRSAYSKLPNGLQTSMRTIWVNNPEQLPQFCSHVLRFGDSSGYQLLLKDSELFSEYRTQLARNGIFTRQLEQIAGASNQYYALRALLKPEEKQDAPARPQAPAESFCGRDNPAYERVIILGGIYHEEEKRELQKSATIPVTVYEQEEIEGKSLDMIRKGDLVYSITKHTDHSSYGAAKNLCDAVGAEFRHFNHQNVNLLKYDIHRKLKWGSQLQ